tara:strand:+ start:2936 stop:3148 length:213 start_codon:yes stop_codon:yes gene_type:complete
MDKQKNTVTINDVEYEVDDLDETQKYIVLQIRDIRSKISEHNFRLTQLQAAQTTFYKSLAQSTKKDTDDE